MKIQIDNDKIIIKDVTKYELLRFKLSLWYWNKVSVICKWILLKSKPIIQWLEKMTE